MYRRIVLLLLGLTLGGISWAWAQPGSMYEGGGFQDRFLEIKRTQLGPALGVDQQKVNQLLAIDQRYKPLRHQLIMEMKADLRHLQQLMNQPSPPEGEIRATLEHMKRKRLEMLNLQQRKDEEESALLTPVQQARYILYLMTLVREARSVRGGPRGAAPPIPKPPTEIPVSRPPR